MKTETRVTILLSERECRAASVNSGITIDLPPETTQVIIRVVREEEGPTHNGVPA